MVLYLVRTNDSGRCIQKKLMQMQMQPKIPGTSDPGYLDVNLEHEDSRVEQVQVLEPG